MSKLLYLLLLFEVASIPCLFLFPSVLRHYHDDIVQECVNEGFHVISAQGAGQCAFVEPKVCNCWHKLRQQSRDELNADPGLHLCVGLVTSPTVDADYFRVRQYVTNHYFLESSAKLLFELPPTFRVRPPLESSSFQRPWSYMNINAASGYPQFAELSA